MEKLLLFAIPILLLFTIPLANAEDWDGSKKTNEVKYDLGLSDDEWDKELIGIKSSCNQLDLMCRQNFSQFKDIKNQESFKFYKIKGGKFISPEPDRVTTFDKQLQRLNVSINFLERHNLQINDYLLHNTYWHNTHKYLK